MFAKLNHVAIVSENYAVSGKFYEAIFGMRTASAPRPARAVTVGDGYVGLNINPRFAGRPCRLDHFGIQVADSETAFERLRRLYPRIEWQKRPANRPFAGVTTHDPDGNVFDISQMAMSNRRDVYVENEERGLNPRHIDHFAFRTLNPDSMATFYREVFELEPRNREEGDPNHYLTDGHITMVIMPWHITDYEGTGIVSPMMDHFGFKVDSYDSFKADFDKVTSENPQLRPYPVGSGAEGQARLELSKRSCPLCQHHMADVDGILLSVSES
jgi:catechol 2,3-dioxygenase-like lactoylglutathione lyase family enzyme